MKQPLPGLTNPIGRFLFRILPVSAGILLIFSACENDIEKINAMLDEINMPDESSTNIKVQYTDSGRVTLVFEAPLADHYIDREEPYYEFPKGIEVLTFDKNEKPESAVRSGYAIYFEKDQLWEARDSVVARNLQTGEKLTTEQMFWNQKKEFFYSNVFTKIENEDGIFYGENGFEAQQNLEKYKLKGSTGTVNVKEEDMSETEQTNDE